MNELPGNAPLPRRTGSVATGKPRAGSAVWSRPPQELARNSLSFSGTHANSGRSSPLRKNPAHVVGVPKEMGALLSEDHVIQLLLGYPEMTSADRTGVLDCYCDHFSWSELLDRLLASIDSQFETGTTDEKQILRESTWQTSFLTHFASAMTRPLVERLWGVIREHGSTEIITDSNTLERDGVKTKKIQGLQQTNAGNLMEVVNSCLRVLDEYSRGEVPASLMLVCKRFKSATEHGQRALGSFLFLTTLHPALLIRSQGPDSTTHLQRMTILVTKVMQEAVNGCSFHQESMTIYNPYLPRVTQLIHPILNEFATGGSPSTQTALETTFSTPQSLEVALSCFERFVTTCSELAVSLRFYVCWAEQTAGTTIFSGKPPSEWTEAEKDLWTRVTGIRAVTEALKPVIKDPSSLLDSPPFDYALFRAAENLAAKKVEKQLLNCLQQANLEAIWSHLKNVLVTTWSPWWVSLWLQTQEASSYGSIFMLNGIDGPKLLKLLKKADRFKALVPKVSDRLRLKSAIARLGSTSPSPKISGSR